MKMPQEVGSRLKKSDGSWIEEGKEAGRRMPCSKNALITNVVVNNNNVERMK